MKKKLALIVTLLLGTLLQVTQSSAETTLTLAYQGPLTGPEGAMGQMQLRAVQFAIKEFAQNNPSSPTINLIQVDDQGDPAIAQPIAAKTSASTGILGIIGPAYSGATRVSIQSWTSASLAAISPSATNPAITTILPPGTSTFFRVAPVDYIDAISLLNAATYKVANPRIAIISDASPYSESYSRALETAAAARGFKIVSSIGISDSNLTSSGVANTIAGSQANVVIDTGYSNHLLSLASILRASGYQGVISATSAANDPQAIAKLSPSITDGLRLGASNVNLEDISSELASKFQRITGSAPDIFTVPTIDATNVFLSCLNAGARTRQDTVACVRKFNGNSIDGSPLSFQINGNYEKMAFPAYEVKNRTLQLMQDLYRVTPSINPVATAPSPTNSSSSSSFQPVLAIKKGNFNLSVSDFSNQVKIPSGPEALVVAINPATLNTTVEASLRSATGKVTRLPYPVSIEALNPGDYTIDLTIKGGNIKTSQLISLKIKQMSNLVSPKFTVSYPSNGSIKISFNKLTIAATYDIEIQVNGVFQRVVSNISPGDVISGFKPGLSTAITLVANSDSEYLLSNRAVSPPFQLKIPNGTITCKKGAVIKTVTGSKCPAGYKAQ